MLEHKPQVQTYNDLFKMIRGHFGMRMSHPSRAKWKDFHIIFVSAIFFIVIIQMSNSPATSAPPSFDARLRVSTILLSIRAPLLRVIFVFHFSISLVTWNGNRCWWRHKNSRMTTDVPQSLWLSRKKNINWYFCRECCVGQPLPINTMLHSTHHKQTLLSGEAVLSLDVVRVTYQFFVFFIIAKHSRSRSPHSVDLPLWVQAKSSVWLVLPGRKIHIWYRYRKFNIEIANIKNGKFVAFLILSTSSTHTLSGTSFL